MNSDTIRRILTAITEMEQLNTILDDLLSGCVGVPFTCGLAWGPEEEEEVKDDDEESDEIEDEDDVEVEDAFESDLEDEGDSEDEEEAGVAQRPSTALDGGRPSSAGWGDEGVRVGRLPRRATSLRESTRRDRADRATWPRYPSADVVGDARPLASPRSGASGRSWRTFTRSSEGHAVAQRKLLTVRPPPSVARRGCVLDWDAGE